MSFHKKETEKNELVTRPATALVTTSPETVAVEWLTFSCLLFALGCVFETVGALVSFTLGTL